MQRLPERRQTYVMRVLAIDFGEARIGLAISDPEGRLAVPLTTLHRSNDMDTINEIERIVEREQIEQLVMGEPRNLDGSIGESALRVRSFTRKILAQIDLPCEWVDETLTSVEATERLRDAGVDLRRQPDRIDAVAAQILLEQYLSSQTETRDG